MITPPGKHIKRLWTLTLRLCERGAPRHFAGESGPGPVCAPFLHGEGVVELFCGLQQDQSTNSIVLVEAVKAGGKNTLDPSNGRSAGGTLRGTFIVDLVAMFSLFLDWQHFFHRRQNLAADVCLTMRRHSNGL